jgi:hypothetical protein
MKKHSSKTIARAGFIAMLLIITTFAGKFLWFPSSATELTKPVLTQLKSDILPSAQNQNDTANVTNNVAVVKGDYQEVTILLTSNAYAPIIVQKGIPVRFNIQANEQDINGCNGTVVIPEYKLETVLKPGSNLLEFTPDKSGTIPYSCWMGMVTSTIKVVDDISQPDQKVSAPVNKGFKMGCCQRNSQ